MSLEFLYTLLQGSFSLMLRLQVSQPRPWLDWGISRNQCQSEVLPAPLPCPAHAALSSSVNSMLLTLKLKPQMSG